MTLLRKIGKTSSNKHLRTTEENSAHSINQSLITTYESSKRDGNRKQREELIKLLQCENQRFTRFLCPIFQAVHLTASKRSPLPHSLFP